MTAREAVHALNRPSGEWEMERAPADVQQLGASPPCVCVAAGEERQRVRSLVLAGPRVRWALDGDREEDERGGPRREIACPGNTAGTTGSCGMRSEER